MVIGQSSHGCSAHGVGPWAPPPDTTSLPESSSAWKLPDLLPRVTSWARTIQSHTAEGGPRSACGTGLATKNAGHCVSCELSPGLKAGFLPRALWSPQKPLSQPLPRRWGRRKRISCGLSTSLGPDVGHAVPQLPVVTPEQGRDGSDAGSTALVLQLLSSLETRLAVAEVRSATILPVCLQVCPRKVSPSFPALSFLQKRPGGLACT